MSNTISAAEEEVWSDLAHKLVDQVALYGLAVEIAKDPGVMKAIQSAKDARAHMLQDISAKIWLRDLPLIEQATKLGTAQNAFQRLREIVDEVDAGAIAEVVRGEEYLRDRVTKAAADERLTAHTRNYLQTVLSRVDSTLEELRQLQQSIGKPS